MSNLNSENSKEQQERPITVEYIERFLEKKKAKNPYRVKTKYGNSLGEKFSENRDLIRRRLQEIGRF